MKAARIHRFGPPDVIVIDDVPKPRPGPGEVLVRVAAAGVGPWDASDPRAQERSKSHSATHSRFRFVGRNRRGWARRRDVPCGTRGLRSDQSRFLRSVHPVRNCLRQDDCPQATAPKPRRGSLGSSSGRDGMADVVRLRGRKANTALTHPRSRRQCGRLCRATGEPGGPPGYRNRLFGGRSRRPKSGRHDRSGIATLHGLRSGVE